jgi:hypothetical protein
VKPGKETATEMKGFEMILQDENHIQLYIRKHYCFCGCNLAVKTFISVLTKYGFKFCWYRIIIELLLIYFTKLMEKIAPEAYLEGQILLIDKPLKWSSFQAE